jgi:hypothetical protein
MFWRHQIEAFICAVFILIATVALFALKTPTPVVANRGSMPSDEPNRSSQSKETSRPAESFEIETSWNKGSLWDDEAPAYDLSQPPATSEMLACNEFRVLGARSS